MAGKNTAVFGLTPQDMTCAAELGPMITCSGTRTEQGWRAAREAASPLLTF
jgi:hypothetical protein